MRRRLRPDFFEEFTNRGGIGQSRAVGLDQYRNLPGRIEAQEILAPFPGLFELELEIHLLFGEDDSHLAAEGRQPKVIEGTHRVPCIAETAVPRQTRPHGLME